MEQIAVAKEKIIDIDYDRPGMPASTAILHPILYKEGNEFICVLGPDLQNGIVGKGDTPETAAQQWDKVLQQRRKENRNDTIDQYVREKMNDHQEKKDPGNSVAEGKSTQASFTPGNNIGVMERKNSTDQMNTDGSE